MSGEQDLSVTENESGSETEIEEEPEQPESVADAVAKSLKSMRGEEDDESAQESQEAEAEAKPAEKENAAQAASGEQEGALSEEEEEARRAAEEEEWKKTLSRRSRERFEKVTSENRSLREQQVEMGRQMEEVMAAGRQLNQIFTESGLDPDTLTAFFEFHKNARSGNLQVAQQYWDRMSSQVAQSYGFGGGGNIDVSVALADYPDLVQAVDNLDITEQAALEIAQYRRGMAIQHQQTEQAQQQAQQRTEVQQAYGAGAKAVTDWENRIKSSDPDYEWEVDGQSLKKDMMAYFQRMQDSNVHPAYWEQMIDTEYKRLKSVLGRASSRRDPRGTVRPSSRRAGSPAQAATMAGAMEAWLEASRSGRDV